MARQSKGNFCWLIEYGKELCKEYTWRYKRKHKSEEVIDWCGGNKAILEQKLDDATQKGRQEGIQVGHEKGKIEGKIEVAKNSLKAGVSIDVIAQITGLSVDEIQKLRN